MYPFHIHNARITEKIKTTHLKRQPRKRDAKKQLVKFTPDCRHPIGCCALSIYLTRNAAHTLFREFCQAPYRLFGLFYLRVPDVLVPIAFIPSSPHLLSTNARLVFFLASLSSSRLIVGVFH